MWTAHFLFHLLSGWNSVVPPVQHLIGSDRILTASTPLLRADTMLRLQVLLLDVGLVYALYCAWKVAGAYAARTRATLALWLPFALFAVTFYAGAVWVFLQPMEMRGMIH